jgi:hypothetical protein
MRTVLGIIGGLVAGVAAIILVGMIGVGMTFSVPSGVDPSDTNQVLEAFANAPLATQIAMMAAWFAGGLVGAWVGKRVTHSGAAAWIVAALIAAYVLANVLVLPLPAWVQALWIAAPLLGGLIGNHLVGSRVADTAAADAGGGEVGTG